MAILFLSIQLVKDSEVRTSLALKLSAPGFDLLPVLSRHGARQVVFRVVLDA
jgi:hypothetical protein